LEAQTLAEHWRAVKRSLSFPSEEQMRRKAKAGGLLVAAGFGSVGLASFIAAAPAQGALVESFENTLDGWQVPSPFGSQGANFQVGGFSPIGATDGATSLAIGPTVGNVGAAPNYSQMMISPDATSPYALNLTALLQNAASISYDIYTPPGSFGFFLQFDTDINNSATGFVSLDGFSYQSTTIGSETTITVPMTAALRSALMGSGTGTQLIIQVGGGFTAGNETFYIDNIRTSEVPEPASLGALAGISVLTLTRRSRTRRD
jgi:hypothetical protein